MASEFEEYENIIYAIAQMIYTCYVDRYIKKQWVTVEIEEFNVIRKCHSIYEADRQNRITLKKVIDVLNEQSPTNINKMIRRFQNKKNNKHTQRVPTNVDKQKRILTKDK